MHKFLQIGAWISIFVTGALIKTPFDFYLYYFFFFGAYPYLLFNYGLSKRMLAILVGFLLIGFYFVMTGDNKAFPLIKVWGGIFLSYSFYYMYLKHMKFQVFKIMELYMHGAYVCGIVAYIQQFFFKLHFRYGYNFNLFLPGYKWGVLNDTEGVAGLGRAASLISEPSSYAMVAAPAVFVVFCSLIYKDLKLPYLNGWQKFTIVAGYLLSLSSTAFIGLGIMALLILINTASFRQVLLASILFVGVGYLVLNYNEAFSRKFSTLKSLTSVDINKIIDKSTGLINQEYYNSSIILYANFDVALKNFKKHPLFGTGIGSHPVAFKKYSFFRFLREEYQNNVNDQDANSLFNRLMSETGIAGLGLFLYMILKFYIHKRNSKGDDRYWVFNNAFLIIVILFFIRQGNYFFTGFPLFVWMYYINWKNLKNEEKVKVIEQNTPS